MNAEHTHLNSTLPRHWLNTRKPGSLGLFGLRERAAMLGGEATITSTLGHGTMVEARLPAGSAATSAGA